MSKKFLNLRGSNQQQQHHPHPHPGGFNVCGDCGATSPSWASINRGILICWDCCSVHRSLGRHISLVKCLRSSNWVPETLAMVQSLYSCGANSIWEYSLLNPADSGGGGGGGGGSGSGADGSGGGSSSSIPNSSASCKKPSASDPLHPTKSDFIRSKHLNLNYVYKASKDDPFVSETELSRQLHSAVRTPNLETSLRLISQGADPNYYHPEKNSTPLMVAGRAGQSGQVELLLVYGADPGFTDKTGKSASDMAKSAGFSNVSNRLHEAAYELSDRLTYFLCQRYPEHKNGQHFLIPDSDKLEIKSSDSHKIAKRKLQGLSNTVFEELSVDVHDEVDRRETDNLWSQSGNSGNKSVIIPFLPLNPDYGTTRNQGRQKLARLNNLEFASLVIDVLKEIKRRQNEMKLSFSPVKSCSKSHLLSTGSHSDDEPIYDHVASDDDYYQVPETPSRISGLITSSSKTLNGGPDTKNKGPSSEQQQQHSDEFKELKCQLESSELKVQHLIDSNDDMRSEITRLTSTVNKLIEENKTLRVSVSPTHNQSSPRHSSNRDEVPLLPTHPSINRSTVSMYEHPTPSRSGGGPISLPPPGANYMTLQTTSTTSGPIPNVRYQPEYYDYNHEPSSSSSLPYASNYPYGSTTPPSPDLPSQEEVVRRTEAITRCIQELLISAKDEKFDAFIPCSERIVRAVTDMVVLFPEEVPNSGISNSLSSLTAAAAHFETECRILIVRSQKEGPLNSSFVTQQVIQCAFDIAKSTKQLVALFQ